MAQKIEELLSDSQIQKLCITALLHSDDLAPALEEIYQKGFVGTPQIDHIEKAFVRRMELVWQEYSAQREAYLSDPIQWERTQLHIAKDPTSMVCCLGTLAALVHGDSWEKMELQKALDNRMKTGGWSEDQNGEILHLFCQTPMSSVFAGGKFPTISSQIVPQFAGILAMCTYVSVKQETWNVVPELSFDAICIWSFALTDALSSPSTEGDAVAMVGCVMAAQYMGISDWTVLRESMHSICLLSRPIMYKIIEIIRTKVLDSLGEGEYRCVLVSTTERPYDLTVWLRELQSQAAAHEPYAGEEEEDEEETVLEDNFQSE